MWYLFGLPKKLKWTKGKRGKIKILGEWVNEIEIEIKIEIENGEWN